MIIEFNIEFSIIRHKFIAFPGWFVNKIVTNVAKVTELLNLCLTFVNNYRRICYRKLKTPHWKGFIHEVNIFCKLEIMPPHVSFNDDG